MECLKKLNQKIPRRAILGILMFFACMFSYVIRTNLSIIIVAMVEATKKSRKGPYCTDVITNSSTKTATVYIDERYAWDPNTQGFILSAYFIGPLISSVPSGILAEKIGGARVVAYATLIPAILNLLMPYAASLHWGLLLPLRFLMGLTGSAVYPALHAMIARWVPPNEKGLFVWTMQGGPFGTFITFTLCSLIINFYGWKAAYWTTSGLMLIFWAAWVWLVYDTPAAHPNITQEEKRYIMESIGSNVSKQKSVLPVREMAKSLPLWVLLWAHFANMWGIYFISINGPKYTLQILGLNMKSGGFLTGLPYIARLGAGVLFAAAGDFFRRKNILTIIKIRKLFMICSHIAPGVALIIMTYVGCNASVAITMMILALAFNGAACQTSLQNHQDLAPNFAGSIYGVMNVFGSVPGFIISPIIGALTNAHNGVEEWRWMFLLSAFIFFSTTILYWIFGSADIQPWNNSDKIDQVKNIENEEKTTVKLTEKNVTSSDDEENERL
ncbi:sialin-like [Chelonus insularis]|uniref:sialin-like n=1 Tax=Chelonus insularis TaxID=460826 RepID=UPI00158A9278|nr:sialin-like [Chelonus insularis]XP_034945296.1 sialin-like [Chelonus insularis]XP_034945297.1 sialin-like [Chelonus insularis]XP_034945298.1 sialin-like [Chelonus insularis]XP_034945299.1 sialin-like [Chelonus insularis]